MDVVTPSQMLEQKTLDKWMIDPRYEFVRERGTVRLTKFKKSFGPDVYVKKNGVPLIMKASGKPLLARDVLPERADIALDMDGNLISQGNFTNNYMEWLAAFEMVEGSEPGLEPIPNVENYVSQTYDKWSESNGMVEHYFDPKLNDEWEPQAKYDADGLTKEEREQSAVGNVLASLISKLADKIDPKQAAELIQEVAATSGTPIPVIDGSPASSDVAVESDDGPLSSDPVPAPCGVMVKARGVHQHTVRCKNEACLEVAGDAHMSLRER